MSENRSAGKRSQNPAQISSTRVKVDITDDRVMRTLDSAPAFDMQCVVKQVRITDLREPERDAAEQSLFDMALTMVVDLDPADILSQARVETGLSNIGDTGVEQRLAWQVEAVDADAGLSGLGRHIIRERLLGLMKARLRFEDFVRRHPEALDVELEPPVIVVGLPRSGTTHLVNLLAADSRFRSMPWWEVREPTPVSGDGPGRDGVDPRFTRCHDEWEATNITAPLVALMHDRPPWSIEEDCELVDLDLCSYTLEWHARVPGWRDRYLTLEQTSHYAFLRHELQVLSYLRGPRRWVLKTPQHLEQLGPLLAIFPDATVAFTLRDPVAVLQSAITMLAYGDRLRRVVVDADGLAAYWIDRIERLLRAAVRDSHLIPSAQRVDVEFGEFMADDLAMAETILDVAGMAVTPEARDQLMTYLAGNPRGKEGQVVYDLRGDFGLEPKDLYEQFAFYFDAFPQIRREVH
ncbi:MAG: sulfotransferase [Acidimicrobiia bacterium]|nr:sulfotransferase [Acidimicrobiia bacterium]